MIIFGTTDGKERLQDLNITNEEFIKAWENKDNKKIINSAMRRYYRYMSPDDIESCKMIGLWECMKSYNGDLGKFKTYLYRGIQIQCIKSLKNMNKNNHTSLADVVDQSFDVSQVRDSINQLDEEYQNLIFSRFFEMKTLKEIANENNYSHETARRRINKALCQLKKILLK